MPKDGSHYDLPMAISILIASKQILPNDIKGSLFAGELALDGSLRPIRGALSITEIAKQKGFTSIYLPQSNANQAALIKGINVFGVSCLKDMFLVIKNELKLQPTAQDSPIDKPSLDELLPTLDMIHGQENAKRALIIAAAGRHNILFTGSPGAGKTMLAQTLNSLLPSLTEEEKIITTKIHSLAGESTDTVLTNRPFRSPHHSASKISLIGGGSRPIPGEISLSHLGVLFLDEIPEYPRASLEAGMRSQTAQAPGRRSCPSGSQSKRSTIPAMLGCTNTARPPAC
jgi:magnesium chelatase family protein